LLAEGPHGVLVSATKDGEEAMAFLQRSGRFSGATLPDLIVLDLNMPRKDGRAVLAEVRANADWRRLPIVVFSTSQSEQDILCSYELGANCYVSKPGSLPEFAATVKSIAQFWFGFARLPHQEGP
jgi:chemotaxis family two-component system response regulator Rcp1